MSRWKLYLAARKPIMYYCRFDIILVIIYFIEAIASRYSPLPKDNFDIESFALLLIWFMVLSFPTAYYEYLDDILLKRVKVYKGYIVQISGRTYIQPTSKRSILPEKYSYIHSTKQIEIYCSDKRNSDSFITFSCYIKKMWKMIEVGQLVKITYLQTSRIVTEVEVLDDTLDNIKDIQENPYRRSKNREKILEEERKLRKKEHIKKKHKAIIVTILSIIAILSLFIAIELS